MLYIYAHYTSAIIITSSECVDAYARLQEMETGKFTEYKLFIKM